MQPEGLIFDCDGTVVDTMPIHYAAWCSTTVKHGLEFPEERFYALGGVSPFEVLRMLSKEQGVEIDAEAVTFQKEARYMELIADAVEIPEVMQIVREHHGKLPMAIASGGTHETVEGILQHCGIRHYFDAIVTSQDVQNPKPAPDTFLEAARRIKVAPEKCRAYEDADMGIKAIIAAGMEPVDVREMLAAANR
ncbi:MAG: HAD family hydrolase [Verrucomicrobiales bacterium]|jgi:beta-phosphoglucomutase family hydrolase|nr:HAD family hydrolase [Verrucomicrobiales bacterium]MDP6677812.1 beta-phosphoglucomutase family hydrolase [Verrucomicrobiota bacterium]MDP6752392.1 beta-phosphoglucomutase family hydrolase [Verrucomicrobiota bacterium]MDP7013595.1 beta-phosphoglucomutase family hydrolase [Verrucomicrobiota bacterium]|tara:strand:+ start:169 stop:747 length:579 start_codon:yes stop_codon:yes gene_type:complete